MEMYASFSVTKKKVKGVRLKHFCIRMPPRIPKRLCTKKANSNTIIYTVASYFEFTVEFPFSLTISVLLGGRNDLAPDL